MSNSAGRENDHSPLLWPALPSLPHRPGSIGRIKSALSTALGFILLGAIVLVLFLIAMASASRPVQGVYEPSNRIECVRSLCLSA